MRDYRDYPMWDISLGEPEAETFLPISFGLFVKMEANRAVVEAARELRDSLLDEKGMWQTAIFEQLDQTQIHRLHKLSVVLDALKEK